MKKNAKSHPLLCFGKDFITVATAGLDFHYETPARNGGTSARRKVIHHRRFLALTAWSTFGTFTISSAPPTLVSLKLDNPNWVIADLHGKAGHVRTVPVPTGVKKLLTADFSERDCRWPDFWVASKPNHNRPTGKGRIARPFAIRREQSLGRVVS